MNTSNFRLNLLITMVLLNFNNALATFVPTTNVDIIPSPKITELTGKKFVLSQDGIPQVKIIIEKNNGTAAIAANGVNERVVALGGPPLPISTTAGSHISNMNLIQIYPSQNQILYDFINNILEAKKALSSVGEQGYLIRFQGGEDKRVALLSGVGLEGLLHSCNTFRLLIKKEGATIFATEAQITDWPDFKNRGLPVWPMPGSYGEFKKYVDWAHQYKFNRIYSYATRNNIPDGFNLATQDERSYLRRINSYAKDRGIIINYALNWAVGTTAYSQNTENYRGAVLFNGHYYTWGNDSLLRKRAKDIAIFAKDIEAESLHFHCIDAYDEGWDDRGNDDRERFGDDRAAADANVISIFSEEIQKLKPGIELQFVVYPYHINLNLKENEKYKIWIKKLSDLIPNDVHLVVTDFNYDQTASWANIIKQPLVHWINGISFQWGRYFSTYPVFSKSSYNPAREHDIIVNFEPIGYFNGEVMQLFAAEYAWNTNFSGSRYLYEDKFIIKEGKAANLHYRIERKEKIDFNFWAWYFGSSDPEEAARHSLLKACRMEYGDAAAPYMAAFYMNNPIGSRRPGLFFQVLNDFMAGRELDACIDQYKKVENALYYLKKTVDTAKMDRFLEEKLKIFLENTYKQNLIIVSATAYYQAKSLLAKGLSSESSAAINNALQKLSVIRREMEMNGYWTEDSEKWFEEGNKRLSISKNSLRKNLSINLIGNPGFESHPCKDNYGQKIFPMWSATTGSLSISENSHSGKYSGQLLLKSSDRYVLLEQKFDVSPHCNYYIEFWIKKDSGFRVIPIFQYYDINNTSKLEVSPFTDFPYNAAIDKFTLYSGAYTFPSHVRQAVIKFFADWYGFSAKENKYVYIDDIYIGCTKSN